MIFQQFNLVNRLDVLTNVMCGRLHRNARTTRAAEMFTPAERALAIRALDRLGLAEVAMNRADALSGGQQQRVAIARALMQQPRILLADEPIASLDPLNAKVVMDALADINRRDGITVLTNLHTLDTARTYCRRIIGMSAGRIVFDGAPEALTEAVLRDIYGQADGTGALDERITSTSSAGTPRSPPWRAIAFDRGETATMLRRIVHPPRASLAHRAARAAGTPTPRTGSPGQGIPHRPAGRREHLQPPGALRRLPANCCRRNWASR